MDPSTVKLFYSITNTTQKPDPTDGSGNYTNTLLPLANGPWVFFRRMRIICGGQIIEDIDHYNRVHQMIDILNPTNRRINSEIEGFQARSYSNEDIVEDNDMNFNKIFKGETKTVCFTPLSGLFKSRKIPPHSLLPNSIGT